MDADPATVPLDELDRLWDFDDPAGSERRFLALLPRARAERDGARLAELLTQVARARGLQGRLDDADATLDEAEASLRQGTSTVASGSCSSAYGWRTPPAGRVAAPPSSPRRGSVPALRVKTHSPWTPRTCSASWSLPRAPGNGTNARWSSPGRRPIRAPAAVGVAREQHGLGSSRGRRLRRGSDALRARTLGAKAGRHCQAIARWCVGRCLRSLGRVEEALAEQRALGAELDAAGEVEGYVDEELGECLLALGRGDEARAHFSRAYTGLSADAELRANEPERLERLRSLGAP